MKMKRIGPLAATLATTLGLMLAAANPALSQSGESNEFVFKGYRTAPDIPTNLNGTFVKPNQVAVTNLSTFAVTALTFPGVSDNTHVAGYYISPTGAFQLLTFDIPVTLPGAGGSQIAATSHDVVDLDKSCNCYTLLFDGAANGVPNGAKIDALGLIDDDTRQIVLSFDVTVELGFKKSQGRTITALPSDVVRFTKNRFSKVFDSASFGIPPNLNVDGADLIGGGDVLFVFDNAGTLGGVRFTPHDVLGFDNGKWFIFFDGDAHGWQPGAVMKGALGVRQQPSS